MPGEQHHIDLTPKEDVSPFEVRPGQGTRLRIDKTKRCTNGWGPGGCTYTGGCYCEREAGHRGRCRCICGRTRKGL